MAILKIDYQQGQGHMVQHREFYIIFCNNYMGRESGKEQILKIHDMSSKRHSYDHVDMIW